MENVLDTIAAIKGNSVIGFKEPDRILFLPRDDTEECAVESAMSLVGGRVSELLGWHIPSKWG